MTRLPFLIIRLVAALLGFLSLIAAMSAPAQDKSMLNTIAYTSNKADDRFKTELTVNPDGAAILKIGSNRDRRSSPSGLFKAVIPSHLMMQLSQDTADPAFTASPSQAQLVPDKSFREITVITHDKSRLVKLVGEELATPAPFSQAEKTIETIILHVLKFPVIAITLQVSLFPEQNTPGQIDQFNLNITNVGKKVVYFDAPTKWGESASQGDIAALRTDIPLPELTSNHQQFVQLNSDNFQAASPSFVGPKVRLDPNEGVTLGFQQKFNWPPGRYKVDIDLVLSLVGEDDQPLMSVGVVSAPKNISISTK